MSVLLNEHQIDELVELLEACDAMKEPSTRSLIVNRLPVSGHVPHSPVLRTYLTHLVQACNNHHHGLARLYAALLRFAQETHQITAIETFFADSNMLWVCRSDAVATGRIVRKSPATGTGTGAVTAAGIRTLSVFLDRIHDEYRVRLWIPRDDGDTYYRSEHMAPAALLAACEDAVNTLSGGNTAAIKHLLSQAPRELGRRLFRVLFGRGTEWRSTMRAVFARDPNEPDPMPILAPVRVHIVTYDELASALPWRLIAWQNRLLIASGWRIAVSPTAQSERDIHTRTPPRVLIVAPQSDGAQTGPHGDMYQPGHAQAVRECVGTFMPADVHAYSHYRDDGLVNIVGNRRALIHQLHALKPDLLYVYATIRTVNDVPHLVLDQDDVNSDDQQQGTNVDHASDVTLMPLAELAHHLEQANASHAAVYLNTAADRSLIDPLGEAELPLRIWRACPARTVHTTTLALSWLTHWLGEGRDPVDALHRACKQAGMTQDPEAASVVACANYRTWSTPQADVAAHTDSPLMYLDRDEAKDRVMGCIAKLTANPAHRVMALVACAQAGNHVDDLCAQLENEFIARDESHVAVNWLAVELPLSLQHHYRDDDDWDARMRNDLKAALRDGLGAEPGESLRDALWRRAPVYTDTARKVVWLDWGTCGSNHDQPMLKSFHLSAWLWFAAESLVPACAEDVRVISYLALEHSRPGKISALLESWRSQLMGHTAFDFEDFELGAVEFKHLLRYFRDHTQCPSTMHQELAEGILRQTKGDYSATVAQLNQALRTGSWRALRDQLCRGPRADIDTDKDPLDE